MPAIAKLALLLVLSFVAWTNDASASRKKTVCTITVNSSDEKDLMRATLPSAEFDFVELVEHGRPDWLASACKAGTRCDVLVISGHFDGGTQFYSDRLHVNEYLPVDEMERAACSDSCGGLFSQLKEVYLFGCNTLNPEPMRSASAEIERSLVRSGRSKADAAQLARLLAERYAESNRDRMRHIFKDVPVIYGFSSKAPLGPFAASTLQRYFQSGVNGEIGSGRVSPKLLSLFAPVSMTVATGASDADLHAGFRRDVCQFRDDRLSVAQKVGFVHQLMRREMSEVRMLLDHIEKYVASLDAKTLDVHAAEAIGVIASDASARERYLEFARDADEPAVRARMLEVARRLGWLTLDQQRAELLRMLGERLALDRVGSADVDLACSLNKDGALGRDRAHVEAAATQRDKVPHAAVLACLGSETAHARVLRALASADDREVEIAQVYVRHRPIADADELRLVTAGIARMTASEAQIRALDTLARNPPTDRTSLDELLRVFAVAKSVEVQRAVAGILLRADFSSVAVAELARVVRQHRLKSNGTDVIDVLLRRLQAQLS